MVMPEIWMQQGGFIVNILINITGKLPEGLVELYQIINEHANALAIPYLVVGATARDIVLVHGYGARVERGTRDVDFGIQVQTWDQFEQLKASLLKAGFEQHKDKHHQLTTVDSGNLPWEIDIIPFGEIAHKEPGGDDHTIAWPSHEDFVMSVMGFAEAFEDALTVVISETPKLELKVASPAGMLVLKLVSWLERAPDIRGKDATDIYYLSKHYSKIPEIYDALFDQGFMETQDFDEHKASTMKVAEDASKLAEPETLKFINEWLFTDEHKLDNLILDMSRNTQISYEDAEGLLNIMKNQFKEA
jgi:predicted nucleotidyltransferase